MKSALGWGLLGVLGACGVPPLPSNGADAGGLIDAGFAAPSPEARGLLLLEETGPPVVLRLDLALEESTPEFEAPSHALAYELAMDRESGELILAYTPPPREGDVGFDRSGIFSVTASGAATRRACADEPGVWCYYPAIHGHQLWFVQSSDSASFALWTSDLLTQESRPLVDWATEPTVSPDGGWLVWIAVSPIDGSRTLELGDGEGRWQRTLVSHVAGEDLGQPFFSSDGSTIYYVRIPAPTASLFDRLGDLFISPAYAHNNHNRPGDWWSVPISGDAPAAQLTRLQTIQYDGRADPGGEWVFIATREGVLKVSLADGEVTVLLASRTVRALDWF